MNDVKEELSMVRVYIDQLVTRPDSKRREETLDDVLAMTEFENAKLRHAKAFAEEYFIIAKQHEADIEELEKRKEEVSRRPGIGLYRLAYHTIVPGISLGLVASSTTYGAVGATAGFLAEAANQRWWNRAASPAAAGWWGLAGGVIGAAADYWIDSGMPFFMYILAALAGASTTLMQTEKVIDRDTPQTLNEGIDKLQNEHQRRGDAMVERYAAIRVENRP